MKKEELLKRFGKNVKIERIKQDLTQEQLAEAMGVSWHYLACIETGRQNMSLVKIAALAEALHVDIERLLSFKDKD